MEEESTCVTSHAAVHFISPKTCRTVRKKDRMVTYCTHKCREYLRVQAAASAPSHPTTVLFADVRYRTAVVCLIMRYDNT